jgi:hypothetical protein
MQQAQGGALGFLDSISSTLLNVSAAAGQIRANLKGPKTADQTAVEAAARIQAGSSSIPMLWIVGGLGLVVVAVLVLRK